MRTRYAQRRFLRGGRHSFPAMNRQAFDEARELFARKREIFPHTSQAMNVKTSGGRKRTRKSKRGRRKKRAGLKLTRKKLLNILTVPNWWVQEVGDVVTVSLTSAATGAGVRYYTPTGPLNQGFVAGANRLTTWDLPMLFQIAGSLFGVGTPATNLKIHIPRVTLRYTLLNGSNGYVNVSAYICKFRTDIPNRAPLNNIVDLLDSGFRSSGDGLGILEDEYTPFQSTLFTELVHIQRVRKFRMEAGKQVTFHLKERYRMFQLSKYINTGVATWTTIDPEYTFVKGTRFILFKFTGSLATNVTGGALTFTSPKILVQAISRIQYKYIDDRHISLNAPDPIGIASAVDPRIVTEDTDLVTVFQNL